MKNMGVNKACDTDSADYDASGEQQLVEQWSSSKAQINGSLCQITAIFGMSIAGIIVNHIVEQR